MFHPLRLELCPNFDTNPCRSIALKDVNLRQRCRCRAMTRETWESPTPPWLDFAQFPKLDGAVGGRSFFGSRTPEPSSVPSYFFSTIHISLSRPQGSLMFCSKAMGRTSYACDGICRCLTPGMNPTNPSRNQT